MVKAETNQNEGAHCGGAVIAHLQFLQCDNMGPGVARSSDFL